MVLFCRKKGPRMWKGWLEYYLDFFGCCCFLLLNFYLLFTCALTHIQKCTDTHRNIERQNSSLKAKRTHTAGKKILKIESVCGVFTFPFYFRNYFYVSYVRALTCTMVGTPCARNVFFLALEFAFLLLLNIVRTFLFGSGVIQSGVFICSFGISAREKGNIYVDDERWLRNID